MGHSRTASAGTEGLSDGLDVTASDAETDAEKAPLSLADMKQAKGLRRYEKALQQSRPLSLELVAKRSLQGRDAADLEQDLRGLQHLELDRERISSIPAEVSRALPSVNRLYLQHNCFVDMSGLAQMSRLRYLSLAHNSIVEVRGIRALKNLMVLDLSHNLISHLDVAELPEGLQFIQLQKNPIAMDQATLFRLLTQGLPLLRHIDGLDVQISRKLSDASIPHAPSSSSGGDGFTNELVEAALAELEEEDAGWAASGPLPQLPALGKPPISSGKPPLISSGSLEKQGSGSGSFSRNSSKGLSPDETHSPIRITPAASRQASAELGGSPAEVREVLARVREALPTVREASDVGISGPYGDQLELGPRRSRSTVEGVQAIRRMRSEDVLQSGSKGFRATSLPAGDTVCGPRSSGLGRSPGGHSFPLTQPPPDVASHPNEFQVVLSAAVGMLVGSRGPPSGRAGTLTSPRDVASLWSQTQLQRQQVLDSLFAKRQQEDQAAASASSISGEAPIGAMHRAMLKRQDSTISKHRRGGWGGSTINEEMLQGLHERDPPRAEGLSEALQGPPAPSPGEQLAGLSQDGSERVAAERARMSLRLGLSKMLDTAQKRREIEPAAEAALVSELGKLKKMKSLQSLLAVREGHISPQLQVLASMVGAHSRLGSITDKLAQALQTWQPLGTEEDPLPSPGSRVNLPHRSPAHDSSTAQHVARMPSPFEAPSAAGPPPPAPKEAFDAQSGLKLASPFEAASSSRSSQESASRQFLVPVASGVSSSSGSSSDVPDSARTGSKALSSQPSRHRPTPESSVASSGSIPAAVATHRQPSIRRPGRGIVDPSSPGSDADLDPNPPMNRRAARPIFGGIAKLVRGPSGQLEPPPSPVPTTARTVTQRLPSEKLPQATAVAGRVPPQSKAHPPPGSGGPPNPSKPASTSSSGVDSETERRRPPRATLQPRATQSAKTLNLDRAHSSWSGQASVAGPRESERQQALEQAASREAKFQAELWARFSGGAGAAARELHTAPSRMTSRSPFSAAGDSGAGARPTPQQLSSPFSAFSAGNTPATSPFSQAAREAKPSGDAPEDQRLGLSEKGSRGRTWHQGDVAISPFARSHMFVNRPPVHPGHPDPEGRGQSTPPIPATEIEVRMLKAEELARRAPEAISAPADIRLRQALRDALEAHQKNLGEKEPISSQPSLNSNKAAEAQQPGRSLPSRSSSVSPFEAAAAQRHPEGAAPGSAEPTAVAGMAGLRLGPKAAEDAGAESGGQPLGQPSRVSFAADVVGGTSPPNAPTTASLVEEMRKGARGPGAERVPGGS